MLTIQNYLKSLALAAATLVAAASVAFAQDTAKLSGTVVDENGEPLVGAAVMIKDSSTGTVTDLDGAFTLAVPRGATLVVSFIGFQDQEVVPGNRNNIVVTLLTDDKLLDEVMRGGG